MQTSYNWLRELVAFDQDADTLADELTATGTAVQWVKPLWTAGSDIRAVRVTACGRHPSADRLSVCRIDTGDGERTIVCGAPNARTDMMAVWVPPGSTLPDGTVIDSRAVRGVESDGMLCSEAELELSHEGDTIIELPADVEVGSPAEQLFSDQILSFELTPNRPDCMATFGIAREVGALVGKPFRIPEYPRQGEGQALGDAVRVGIEDPEGCPRYAVALIEGLQVGPSPWWLKQRVLAGGMRPINNLVDVTNMVMMETGQPLHAFDYDKMARKEIVVRASKAGEKFTTLDDKEHTLPEDVVLITDGQDTVALGGVMGGLNSEVDASTRTVLLESAYFDPRRTRRTRKALGIESEAALHFEKGTDPNMVPYALDRAAHLLAELGRGTVRAGTVDIYPDPIVPRSLTLRTDRTNQILGLRLTAGQMQDYLRSIALKADAHDHEVRVRVPTFRPDLEREIDLVEEVARLYGYERIPIREQGGGRLYDTPDHDPTVEQAIHRFLAGNGFNEIVTNSMGRSDHYRAFEPDSEPVPVANPLSSDLSHLRTGLLADMATTAAHNFNHRNLDWRLYNIGTVFVPRGAGKAPHEEQRLALALSGVAAPRHWAAADAPVSWYDLRGCVEDLLRSLRLPAPSYRPGEHPGLLCGEHFIIQVDGADIGTAGRLDPMAARLWDIKEDLWLAELSLPALVDLRRDEPRYHPLPRYPGVMRDLALVVDESVAAESLSTTIREMGGALLMNLELFDLYRGKPLEKGTKSLAFSLFFQSPERSLQATEIDAIMDEVVQAVGSAHQAELRT